MTEPVALGPPLDPDSPTFRDDIIGAYYTLATNEPITVRAVAWSLADPELIIVERHAGDSFGMMTWRTQPDVEWRRPLPGETREVFVPDGHQVHVLEVPEGHSVHTIGGNDIDVCTTGRLHDRLRRERAGQLGQ